jgi:hypothetical protein
MSFSMPLPMPPTHRGVHDEPEPVEWVDEVEPEPAEELLPRGIRVGIVLAMVSLILLTRFGLNTGSYGLNFGVPVLYVMIFAGLAKDRFNLDLMGLILYTIFIGVGAVSLMANLNLGLDHDGSTASLILLAVLYLPFVFLLRPFAVSREAWMWTMRAFSNLALFVAVVGVFQFVLQFAWRPAWLFDFSPLIPKIISADVLANSSIYTGSAYKANGFFLREPSAFSFLMAFSLICEMALFKRWTRMCVFAAGLMLSYSGTGLLALAFGLMFPFGFKTAMRIGLIVVVGLILVVLFGDALNLTFTLGRINEFNSESSSGYIRYVAPMRLINEMIDSSAWTAFVGHGPGTIFHAGRTYEFHDPTWAKLLYEYGIVGFASCLGLMVYAMSRSHAPVQIRATLFFCWLVQGGHLLTPENVMLIYVLLSMWPAPGSERRRQFHGSTMPMTTMQFEDRGPYG